MKKTYAGNCHCNAVRFEAEIDLDAGTSKCNCSICMKSRMWKAIIPSSDFRLLRGAADLADYTFGRAAIHHRFCRHCGVKVFGSGDFEPIGPFHAIAIACLDMPDAERAAAPVTFEDGRHDNWGAAPAVSIP